MNAIDSILRFPSVAGDLHLRKEHDRKLYRIEDAGEYQVFRETTSTVPMTEPPVVLVIGFRLKCIGSNRLLHRLFQRVCITTTPFWAGLPGFRVKLWMVDPQTKNYLGIYEWRGEAPAQGYIDFLLPILGIFSKKESIWYRSAANTPLEEYLKPRAVA